VLVQNSKEIAEFLMLKVFLKCEKTRPAGIYSQKADQAEDLICASAARKRTTVRALPSTPITS
jgi:hypothetical protein